MPWRRARLGFVEIAERAGDPAQFDEIAPFPVAIGHFLGRCRPVAASPRSARRAKTLSSASSAGGRKRLCRRPGRGASEVDLQFGGASARRAASTVSL
ncbi:hypothetical protein [Candidatus Accumulibacter contiguus]|uniref:hypothetical protein n=1 Tax=Candidatus Accumulibacter contiguus TaxID=2954381 RepID=UPI002FC299C3